MKAVVYKDWSQKKNERILNVTEAPFGKNFLGTLLGLRAFSGYDSTSTFHGIGKRK